mgnify:CR=1 FL=1
MGETLKNALNPAFFNIKIHRISTNPLIFVHRYALIFQSARNRDAEILMTR